MNPVKGVEDISFMIVEYYCSVFSGNIVYFFCSKIL